MIKWFNEIDETEFNKVGGKGYNLSRMYNHGLNVPNGFVITAAAYDEFIASHNLAAKIEAILQREIGSKEQSGQIQAALAAQRLPDELVSTLQAAVAKIPSGRVAVRSSSTVEDLPGMSFAGQYSSYLNVTANDLAEKVLLCWQSLWNERAIDYRRKNNVTADFSHAVVVQEMIEAQVSGVIFTANPLNGIRDEMLVNATFGLGEALVSGEVHPDQYRLDKPTGQLLEEEIAQKEVLCQYAAEGLEYVPVADAKQSQSSLTAAQMQTIVAESQKIEAYFGSPQDIEFAIDAQNNFYVLQAREITSLFPIDELDHDGKLRAYLCASSVMLGMKEPFTPLGFDWMSQMFPTIINVMTAQKEPLDNSFVKPAANRIYVDMTYLLSRPFIGRQFGKAFAGNDLPLEDTMNAMLDQHAQRFSRQGIKFKIPWGIFKYSFSMIGTFRAVSKLETDELYDEMKALGDALYAESKAQAQHLQTVDEKLAFGQKLLVDAFKLSQTQGLYCTAFTNLPKLEKKVHKWFGDRFDTTPLNHAFPDCITVELGMALNYLAKFFDEEGLEPTAEHPKMVAFLEKFGHRSTIELDFGVPRWSEEPEYILNLVKSYMVDQMYVRNVAEQQHKAQQAKQLIEDIYQALKADKGERRAHKFREQIVAARVAAGMREYPKFDIVRMLALARKIVLEVGRDYVDEGLLEQPEDIFFLHLDDLKRKQGLREVVQEHKAAYEKEMARTSIPRIVLNSGETYYSAQKIDPNSKVLQGMPLSPGSYEGQIRVVFDPSNSKLQEGEIMVTESTNPAWTPLFITAKGLIMEYGGPVSHGGIVAREYGIPAVVGISSATSVLQDGQRVRINGETGTVEILD